MLVHQNGTPRWRLRTKLYKGAWNVSANNSETVGHKDLRLGQIVYILVFYNISLSWLLLEDGSQYTFLLRDSENDLYDTVLGWQTLASKNVDRWRSQNPRAWISNLASRSLLYPLFNWSLEMSWRTGSTSTSLHTILRNWASRSLSSLWRWVIKPPSLQIIDWSTVKVSPQAHVEGISCTG